MYEEYLESFMKMHIFNNGWMDFKILSLFERMREIERI